ncbi:MAG: D-alanine--D-alanine ligase [Flavobacteriaceae bacterium]|nr:D-alanine--D-alanine ligase [Flavobacteriaceae bacterium]
MQIVSKIKIKSFFIRSTQWEHWPTIIYYIPLFPFFIYRSIKAGHIIFFLATNPGILFSGNGTESKYKTLLLVPEKYRPKSILILKKENFQECLNKIDKLGLEFPIIAKPDIGFRGYLVKKINTKDDLKRYLQNVDENKLIQEFITYNKELGIFYHRIPGNTNGKITSITIKRFLTVTGDGVHTLSELIKQDERAFLYFNIFQNIHKEKMKIVFELGKTITLTAIGNHSKGTEFLNGNHLISNELTQIINQICTQIDGWYYGRLDIKYENFKNLLQGKNLKILEVNGIISEPTHIYDASYKNASFFKALKNLNHHWKIMGKIAMVNHEEFGVPYPKFIPLLKNLLWLRKYSKKLSVLNKKTF